MDGEKRQTVTPGDSSADPRASEGRGLPFIPSLIPLMPGIENTFVMDPFNWIQVCLNDPTRWTLVVSTPDGIPFNMTTKPDPNVLSLGISCTGSVSLGFKDFGTMVTASWWVYGRGASVNVTCVETSLRNRRG
jgi:hypothetical protein